MAKKLFLFFFLIFFSFGQAQVAPPKKEAIAKNLYKPLAKNATPGGKNSSKSEKKIDPKVAQVKKQLQNEKEDTDLIIESLDNYLAIQMINNAMEFIGVNYKWGGTSRSGMDCSGMVTAVFNIFGLKLPRSSTQMAHVGKKVALKDAQKGDLVFFKTSGKKVINHVGLVIEKDGEDIKFIHSSSGRGVIISSTKETYYKRAFAQANRVIM